MRQDTNPSQGALRFELTQEQALHIAASLASDISSAEDLMPADFHLQHLQLLDLFLKKLSEKQKSRVLGAISRKGVLQ